MKQVILFFSITVLLVTGCNQTSGINGKIYKTIKIGSQTWMSENLNVSNFRDGSLIPEATTIDEWKNAAATKKPVWCYYNNDSDYGDKYGKLYNWYAVIDPRGLAPVGWHVPSIEEYKELINFLGGENEAGNKMKSSSGWKANGNGNNSSGFNGLMSGSRGLTKGEFNTFLWSYYWSSSEHDDGLEKFSHYAWLTGLFPEDGVVDFQGMDKGVGCSVRCLKD